MAKDFPIVDGDLVHDCPCTGEVYVLVIRNTLHTPSMNHNLIPPFTVRAVNVTINDVPKIHCEHPMVDYHSISFD